MEKYTTNNNNNKNNPMSPNKQNAIRKTSLPLLSPRKTTTTNFTKYNFYINGE
jgi:hypothetical protein